MDNDKSPPSFSDPEKFVVDVAAIDAFDSQAIGRAAPATAQQYHFDAADLDRVARRLKQRHIQMQVRLLFLYLLRRAYPASARIAVRSV
jgi:hypothetical protein